MKTIDDLTGEDAKKADAAIEKFDKSRKSRTDQHILYDALTNSGLSAEYADEYINMVIGDD